MPKSSNHLTLARQWEILKKIPSRAPGITASQMVQYLADNGYIVSKRSVERDLNELSQLFGIRCNNESIPYGWYWLPNARPNFDSVELAEALSLVLAENILETVLPVGLRSVLAPKFELAHKKLASLDMLPFSKWSNKVRYVPDGMTLLSPQINNQFLEKIQDALVEEVQLKVSYEPTGRMPKDFILHPMSLIQKGIRTYLLAFIDGFDEPRLFALQRFRKVELIDKKINEFNNFSVDTSVNTHGLLLTLGFILFGIVFLIMRKPPEHWMEGDLFPFLLLGSLTIGLVGIFAVLNFFSTRRKIKAGEIIVARKSSRQVLFSSLYIIIVSASVICSVYTFDMERKSNDRLISEVKQVVMGVCTNSLDDIFSEKSGLTSVYWKSFTAEGGIKVVQVDAVNPETKSELSVQFIIEKDGTTKVGYSSITTDNKKQSINRIAMAGILLELDTTVSLRKNKRNR